MKRIFAAFTALLFSAALASAANLPLISGPQDPSQITFLINQLIQSINTGVGGKINAQTGAVATGTGTSEQVLQTYSLPANTLANAGDSVRVSCWGTTGANGNNKTMKLYFGASVIATPTAATNAKGWYLDMVVMRTGAATQAALGRGVVDVTPVTVYQNAGTDALTSAVTIKCSGTDGTSSAADITANGMLVELVK